MTSDSKFGMLRKVLRMLRLSPRASEDVINFIVDLLTGEGKDEESRKAEFPYRLRDDFLSPAELSFFNLLRDVIGERAVLCPKVRLSDLFCVKHSDPGRFRIYTNKIDRKHMDFVLCDPVTMRPFLALELDDRSHKRPDHRSVTRLWSRFLRWPACRCCMFPPGTPTERRTSPPSWHPISRQTSHGYQPRPRSRKAATVFHTARSATALWSCGRPRVDQTQAAAFGVARIIQNAASSLTRNNPAPEIRTGGP